MPLDLSISSTDIFFLCSCVIRPYIILYYYIPSTYYDVAAFRSVLEFLVNKKRKYLFPAIRPRHFCNTRQTEAGIFLKFKK